MSQKLTISEQLKNKYHKTEEVTNFKEMLYRSADIYRSRTAFKKKYVSGAAEGEKTDFDLSYARGIGKFFRQPFRESGGQRDRSRSKTGRRIGKKWIRNNS